MLAVAAASQGRGDVLAASVAASVDVLSFDWAAAVSDALVFATPVAWDADVPLLSPLHAASATVIANKTEINPTPLDIMNSSYEPCILIGLEKLVIRNYLLITITDQAAALRNCHSFLEGYGMHY